MADRSLSDRSAFGREPTAEGLKRSLSLYDAVMLTMGSMIGSGIFFVPQAIALHLSVSSAYIGIWVLGGIVSLLGALSISELGATWPQSGGHYVYLKKAYGPIWGFLAGWTSFSVIMSASIAAVAVASAQCLSTWVSLNDMAIKILAIAAIWGLTGLNMMGVTMGARIQNTLTCLKLAALLGLLLLGAVLSGGKMAHYTPIWASQSMMTMIPSMGLALVAVLWTYDGWIQSTYVAEEIVQPHINIPKTLVISTLGVMALYVLLNMIYVYWVPVSEMVQTPMVAGLVGRKMLGAWGGSLLAGIVFVSTMGANNGFILGGSRIYYAMAKAGDFFPAISQLNRSKAPVLSLFIQAIWASLLTLTGRYDQLFTYVIFASWLFYAMACGAVLILRRKHPDIHRPYKVWGYPYTPVLFILFSLGLVVNTTMMAPRESAIGVGIMLLGLPVYGYCHWRYRNGLS